MNSRGFTLLELMIVISIMGVLSMLVVPSMLTFSQRTDLDSSAIIVVDALKQARSYAENNVQSNGAVKTDLYQVTLLQESGAANNCYNGVRIGAVTDETPPILASLSESRLSCSVNMNASWQTMEFNAPVGSLLNVSATQSVRLCREGYGYVDITIEPDGKITKGSVVKSAASCSCSNACTNLVTPVPTP